MSGSRTTPASSPPVSRRQLSAKRHRTQSPPPGVHAQIHAQNPTSPNVTTGNILGMMSASRHLQTPSAFAAQNPPSNIPGPIMKPKDVPRLELFQLSGLEAAGRLQMFFEAVEKCTTDDSTRVMIAKSKLSTELAMLIHNNQAKNKCTTWNTFCNFLQNEFAVDVNVDRAWQELDDHEYDWFFAPQLYTNKFICRHAVLETRFPKEKFPNRDKSIKRKLWQGMPKESQRRLEAFLEEDYPLNKFIDRVEHERQILLANTSSQVCHLQKQKTSNSPPKETTHESQEIIDLKDQVKNLTQALAKMNPVHSYPPPPLMSLPVTAPPNPMNPFTNPRRSASCPCCYSQGHKLFECPVRPPNRNACFDCHRLGCRCGYPTCPGKPTVNRN